MNYFFNYTIRCVFITILFLGGIKKASCSHLVGGTMFYECLGGDSYRITLTIYRDCNTVAGAPFDPEAPIGIYDSNGTLVSLEEVPFNGSDTIPIILNNPCLVTPPNVCIEKSDYEFIVNLPSIPGGYDIVYQRCCRNSSAVNIVNPASMGSTYQVHIPDSNLVVCNSSPIFNNPPPTTMCTNYEFTYDLSATDGDGDSLVYSFGDPVNGGTSAQPTPNPPSAPPHNNIIWNTGFSTNNQIDANPQFTIDPQTGFLSGTPLSAGFYTFSFTVKEYRNGVFLSEISRDFLLTIANCQVNTDANFISQSPNNLCDGLTINLTDSSTNATFFHWNFGDPTTLSDTSNLQNPTYTYPDTGKYTISLIANLGFFCADTTTHIFNIYPAINASFAPQSPQCLPNNLFTFNTLGTFDSDAVITWDFGSLATPTNSTNINNQVSFNAAGLYPVTLTIEDNGCTETYIDSVGVYEYPSAIFTIESDSGCQPFKILFQDSSIASTALSFLWDFGDGTTSSDQFPIHTYQDTGSFDVTLTVATDTGCVATSTVFLEDLVTVHRKPKANFILNTHKTFFRNHLITADDLSNEFYHQFKFGDGNGSTDRNIEYSYLETGHYLFSQLVITEFECRDTAAQIIWIQPDYNLFVPTAFTPDGDGLNDSFLPQVQGALEYELLLYDRWGVLYFQTTDPKESWDGTYRGAPSPVDTYIWKINSRSYDFLRYQRIGKVVLIR